ncbi:MAG: DUF6263 family protein [Phycisphaerae bacterium]
MGNSRIRGLFFLTAAVIVFSLLGCEPRQQGMSLQLLPAADYQAGYRVKTESHQVLAYEGSLEHDSKFQGGSNISTAEMTFTQKIRKINEQGNILADITIDALKVSSVTRDETTFSYDSTAEQDARNPMTKLIGKSYTIELSPQMEVVRVVNASSARASVVGSSESHKRAQALLRDEEITLRHSISGIGNEKIKRAAKGDKWSNDKSFSFPIIGTRNYERVYTLSNIEQQNGKEIAVINMQGFPAASTEIKAPSLMDMFDSRQTFEGQIKLDIATGLVQSCFEKFDSEWMFVDPMHDIKTDEPPAAFRLGAIRLFSMERIN